MNTIADIQLLSVIVPVGGRRANIKELYSQYRTGVASLGCSFEFVFVLDGRHSDVSRDLDDLLQRDETVTVVNLTRSFGEAAALMAGFEHACGDVIVTLPAYHQIEPSEIRKLVAALEHSDIAVGHRSPRHGNAFDQLRRRAFHSLVNFVTGSQFHDLGCGARAIRRRVFEELDLYGDQHRFLAILATRLGFKVSEVAVRQSSKDRHERVYRPREYARHLLDLFSIFFLVRFTKKPLRFFGMVGAGVFTAGGLLLLALSIQRLFFNEALADRPALLLAALLVVLGLQFFALGLLGELIIFTHARDLKDYRVEKVVHYPDAATPIPDLPSGTAPESPDHPTATRTPVVMT